MKAVKLVLVVTFFVFAIVSTSFGATKSPFAGNISAGSDVKTVYINLGDYAKGDGSDETEAIQRAIDALNAPVPNHKNAYVHREKRGVLIIPAPQKFYGISRTIKVVEKANLVIRCETPVADWQPNSYFKWLGPDDGIMFFFNFCWGLQVDNLSLDGNDKKVMAIQICDFVGKHPGAFKGNVFNNLAIRNVGTGVRLGTRPGNGADVAANAFNSVVIGGFSEYAFITSTGNGAGNTLSDFFCTPKNGANEGIRVMGGQLVVFNSIIGGGPFKAKGAAVAVYSGGVNIYGCWSEWGGPFLYGLPQQPIPGNSKSDSNARFSTILSGVQHYPGGETQFWRIPDSKKEKPESENPVPVSIDWDYCEPLTLINCSFWGGVKLGPNSGNPIIDIGTTFSNRDSRRFYGEGIEKYGRLLQIGTVHPDNVRAVEPYIVDRRNTPGTEPPKMGIWKKGDCIRNTDPDPTMPTKAWAGWICVEAGEPGIWVPYGKLCK